MLQKIIKRPSEHTPECQTFIILLLTLIYLYQISWSVSNVWYSEGFYAPRFPTLWSSSGILSIGWVRYYPAACQTLRWNNEIIWMVEILPACISYNYGIIHKVIHVCFLNPPMILRSKQNVWNQALADSTPEAHTTGFYTICCHTLCPVAPCWCNPHCVSPAFQAVLPWRLWQISCCGATFAVRTTYLGEAGMAADTMLVTTMMMMMMMMMTTMAAMSTLCRRWWEQIVSFILTWMRSARALVSRAQWRQIDLSSLHYVLMTSSTR